MGRFGPFEARPHLAVGVSGGADSMALALLADRWARARSGTIVALTVDHGLRSESGEEARTVGRWLEACGIAHRVLRWRGEKPGHGLPAAAREARYALLGDFCRRRGILHLLLAHHRDDQAETLLLRLARGSGVDGLAAMAPSAERSHYRILRPFLGIERARLEATLRTAGQDWVEDPSNADPAYARARLRALLPRLAQEGLTVPRLAATSARLAHARAALEDVVAVLLARHAAVHPAGFVLLEWAVLDAQPQEVALRLLSRALMAVSGAPYPPRLERLARLRAALEAGAPGRARTLLGCRIAPALGRLLVCREASDARTPLAPGGSALWDRRFVVRLARAAPPQPRLEVKALGASGWRWVAAARPDLAASRLPAPVRETVPALFDLEGPLAVPHFNFCRQDAGFAPSWFGAAFRPANGLAGFGFSAFAPAAPRVNIEAQEPGLPDF